MAGLRNAGHTESDPDTETPLLVLASCPVDANPAKGTRLSGKLKMSLIPGTLAYRIYKRKNISESFQCNYELNPEYRERLESHGLKVSAVSENGGARIIELPKNRFFIGTGFLPQLNLKPDKPHPIFTSFLQSVIEH